MDIHVWMKRDKDKFCRDGYFYIFDRFSADESRKFWRCERKKAPPPIPASLEHLIIPADSEYHLYEHQRGQLEPFLRAESEPRNDAFLIFGRASNLDILERSKGGTWMVPVMLPRDFSLRFWFYSPKNTVAFILSYTDCYPTNQGPLTRGFSVWFKDCDQVWTRIFIYIIITINFEKLCSSVVMPKWPRQNDLMPKRPRAKLSDSGCVPHRLTN